MHRLLQRLRRLDLPIEHYAIFGSGPLLVRGWIDDAGDLDLIAREPALTAALEAGEREYFTEHDVELIAIAGGAITVGTSWAYGDFDVDELIDSAELIDGFPCVLLEHVIEFKRIAGRPKDLEHLEVIGTQAPGSID